MNSILKIILFVIILLTGLAGIAIYWTFYKPLPDYSSTLQLTGLQQEVDIHWDTYGVPHIYAENQHDLYYSVGYVHAQDRLWQMTLAQMVAEGRLAEFMGKDLLPYDQFLRTIGFWRIAEQLETQLSDNTRQILQSYADGVNAYVENHPKSLPLEFSLVDMDPIPWTVTHSLALARMMAWDLNIAWKTELSYSFLHQKLSSSRFRELFPYPELWAEVPDQYQKIKRPDYTDVLLPVLKRSNALRDLLQMKGAHTGSNAWAVNASRTSTGKPLLAGDPHLGLNIPGTWYELHLNLRGRNLSGATLPGAPTLVLGQNNTLAWSLTNVMLDDTDFYEEIVNPENPDQYVLDSLAGDAIHESFEIQREVIKIRNDDDTTFTRRLTKHGPVISDAFSDQQLADNRVITMQWTGYELSNEVEALFQMNWARSMKEFQQGVRQFKVPGQNVIYADTLNNIARFSAVNVPVRTGNPILLRQGWNPEHDWQGYLSFDDLPHSVNPDRGWVANANNPIISQDYPYYLSVYWETDSRYDRIRQYLTQNDVMTPQIFQVMQNDSYSDVAQELTKIILPVLKNAEHSEFDIAVSYLENWDSTYEPSETAASIMDAFLLRLSQNTFEDEMGPEVYQNYITFSAQPIRSIMRFLRNGSTFFDDVTTPEIETEKEIIRRSMREALDFLRSNHGIEPFEWRWEIIHTLTLRPALFAEAADDPDAPPALKLIVNNLFSKGPYATAGHNMSINNGEYQWNAPYDMVLGPSIRRIINLSDISKTLSILPAGQSGNPLSEHYSDQTDSWLNGQYKFLYQDGSFFNENQYDTMTLTPAD